MACKIALLHKTNICDRLTTISDHFYQRTLLLSQPLAIPPHSKVPLSATQLYSNRYPVNFVLQGKDEKNAGRPFPSAFELIMTRHIYLKLDRAP